MFDEISARRIILNEFTAGMIRYSAGQPGG
jgi:hypothetical protein